MRHSHPIFQIRLRRKLCGSICKHTPLKVKRKEKDYELVFQRRSNFSGTAGFSSNREAVIENNLVIPIPDGFNFTQDPAIIYQNAH